MASLKMMKTLCDQAEERAIKLIPCPDGTNAIVKDISIHLLVEETRKLIAALESPSEEMIEVMAWEIANEDDHTPKAQAAIRAMVDYLNRGK